MPKVVYFSLTGYTQEFVNKIDIEDLTYSRIPNNIKEAESFEVDEDFILFVPTYERKLIRGPRKGEWTYIPQQVSAFFRNPVNRSRVKGIIGFGSINFFEDFARAGNELSSKLDVPVFHRVDVSGTEGDVKKVKEGLETFWQRHQVT